MIFFTSKLLDAQTHILRSNLSVISSLSFPYHQIDHQLEELMLDLYRLHQQDFWKNFQSHYLPGHLYRLNLVTEQWELTWIFHQLGPPHFQVQNAGPQLRDIRPCLRFPSVKLGDTD
ncbi:hypothetical protein KFK09_000665 [Dendrobium nobile]|uniref:Uncharacterized protein n=1 Tax=Dendrobium nobile TaxID=94219 RepID=A0A8T3CFE9_DENNO|nr:hypothetical protein KFK09_000665 [Dendrobium nobile]